MKILQVVPYFHPHVGGVESHALALSEGLIKLGHEVTVLTANHTNALPDVEFFHGIKIVRVSTLGNLFNTPINPGIYTAIKRMNFEIAHLHYPPPLASFIAALSLVKMRKPYVLTYHCDVDIPVPLGSIIVEIYQSTMGRYTVENASKVIVHTKTYHATSRSIWNTEPAIIPSAVDTTRFHPGKYSPEIRKKFHNAKIVLFVGRLVHQKGVEFLIESAKYLDHDTVVVIIGDGPERARLEELVKIRKLEHKVFFTGKVSHEELPEYYASADVFVLPSTSRLEAFGLVITEAMACARPVVVSDIPGVNEVIENEQEGLLSTPMVPEDIAKKINTILHNPELARKLGENGRKKVLERYEWIKIARQVEEVYSQVVSSSKR
jgi:glycosyltransferase involved in cell wall biosynthesis